MSEPLKVMTILGTRPEIIRLSEVIKRLDDVTEHVLVHTGQNYDYELNELFFEELGVRKPDHFLAIDTKSLGRAYGNILIETEKVLLKERPEAVLVLGDTNSAISAIMARRLKVPVFHMEAGNRSFDENVPEEVNRRIVDHIADVNLVYTERARQHLLAEGLPARRIYLTGSPLREVLTRHISSIDESPVLEQLGLTPGAFVLASIHREENVDLPDRLSLVLECLNAVADRWDIPVIVSTHPRTRQRLDLLPSVRGRDGRVTFARPFGFFDYNRLQTTAKVVVSDSGSISEESVMLGFPAVTLRDSMERPEAMDAGAIILAALRPSILVSAIEFQIRRWAESAPEAPPEYLIADTANRVVSTILSLAPLSNAWAGVRSRRDEHP